MFCHCFFRDRSRILSNRVCKNSPPKRISPKHCQNSREKNVTKGKGITHGELSTRMLVVSLLVPSLRSPAPRKINEEKTSVACSPIFCTPSLFMMSFFLLGFLWLFLSVLVVSFHFLSVAHAGMSLVRHLIQIVLPTALCKQV